MNNSSNFSSRDPDGRMGQEQIQKSQYADFNLTTDQHFMLQYYLPKKYALLQVKPNAPRRGPGNTANKNQNLPQQRQNVSRVSFQNNSQFDRSKRSRIKKIDRYLDQQPIKQQPKRSVTEKMQLDDQMLQCLNLLNNLKKHRSAIPFLNPVDPKNDGAYNYLQIIKQPMDLSTIERNLKNGQYQTSGQFHGDICKIWHNSYAYNQKTSSIYKMTIQMQKYYKNLLTNDTILNKTTTVRIDKSKIKDRKINEKSQKNIKTDDKRKRKSESKLTVNLNDSMKQQIIQDKIQEKEIQNEEIQENQQDKDYDGYD